MTVRKLMTAAVALGLTGPAVAQDLTPTQPSVTPAPTAPGVVQGGYAAPMTYTYPQGQIVQSGYTPTSMPYGYPQGQIVQSGYAAPTIYSQPGMMTTYGTPSYGYPATGYPTVGTGYAPMTFANGYPTMTASNSGTVRNVVNYPARTARRLFRR